MAEEYSAQQIADYIQGIQSQGGGNAEIAAAMDQFNVTPAQVAAATGTDTGAIQGLYNAVAPTGNYAAQEPTGIASIPVNNVATDNISTSPVDTFTQAYAANPKLSNVQIGQLISDLGLTPAQAATVTGVNEKTATENYLSGQQLLANNSNLANAYNTVQQGGQVQVSGYNDETGQPEYALNNQIVTKNKDGTYSFQSGNNSRGGTDTYTFNVDAQGNAVAPKDPLTAYSWTPGSSSSFADLTKSSIKNMGPLGQIGLAIATGGMSLPEQLAANFAYSVAGGANPATAAKNLAASYVGSQVLGLQDIKDITSSLDKIDSSGISSQAFKGAVAGVTKGALTGQDLVNSALAGAKGGGIYGATAAITDNLPELEGLTDNQRKAVNNVVTGMLSGKPLDQLAINAAISVAKETAKDITNKTPATDIINVLKNAGLSETDINNSIALFNTGQQIPISNYNNDITAVVGDSLTAASDNSVGPQPLKANELQLDRVTGMPKYIGVFDYQTQSNVPTPIKQDASGSYYYVVDGEPVGIDKTVYERAFYKANPQAYLDMAQKVYGGTGNIDQINANIQKHLADMGLTNTSGATPVTTVENQPSGKPSTFSDFLSKINVKGVLGGDLLEIGGALTIPEIAEISLKAQSTGNINDIADYFNKSTKPSDQQFYQDLMKEVVAKNPSLSDNKTVQDILSREVQNVYTPALTPEEIVVTAKKLADNSLFIDEYGNELTKDQVNEIAKQTGTQPKVTPIPNPNVIANPLKPINPPPIVKPVDNNPPPPPPPPTDNNIIVQPPIIKDTDLTIDGTNSNITAPITNLPGTPYGPGVTPPVPPVIVEPPPSPPSEPPKPPVEPPSEPPKSPVEPLPPESPKIPIVSTPPSTKKPTTVSPQTGLTMPQAVAAAAAFGVPQLANMFYYGKEFGTKKQRLDKKGELEEEEYKPLSVEKPGAEPEQVAEKAKVSENDISGLLEHILGSNSASLDEILNIVKGA